ncbi:sigma-54-dependent transcriptional regulator [Candidatus Auribacterota bacterium]
MPSYKPNILLIDDQQTALSALSLILEKDCRIFVAHSGREGLVILKNENIHIVFLDIMMPEMRGDQVLDEIKKIDTNVEVIMASGSDDVKIAISTMKKGAFDYITKPFDADEVMKIVKKVLEKQSLLNEITYLKSELPTTDFKNIIGKSKKISDIFKMVKKVSPNDSTILITGESGTGKELIARAIHEGSPRKERHFVAVNCAAIPENLLESELFGYEKGAFTGAAITKVGRFELADEGTIFLDEIFSKTIAPPRPPAAQAAAKPYLAFGLSFIA